jgi:hypothetical protein
MVEQLTVIGFFNLFEKLVPEIGLILQTITQRPLFNSQHFMW